MKKVIQFFKDAIDYAKGTIEFLKKNPVWIKIHCHWIFSLIALYVVCSLIWHPSIFFGVFGVFLFIQTFLLFLFAWFILLIVFTAGASEENIINWGKHRNLIGLDLLVFFMGFMQINSDMRDFRNNHNLDKEVIAPYEIVWEEKRYGE
jgi:hypothetical protein